MSNDQEKKDKEIINEIVPTETKNEKTIYIEDEIKASYLDYCMSVIVQRALPDVRDGLKPVHRRILFAMNDMGMTHDKPFKKSARIVGEVLGKYHPHGDTAVYNSMVRMAQHFNFRYPLINGHGNFGSVDGDGAAAMRYTEARLNKITSELLKDIEKGTIDYKKNFDDTLDEPEVLPAKLPNLLINGAAGIAVGMATNIPPHNLVEIIDGTIKLIDNNEASIEELSEIITGPDFPTGAIINGAAGIKLAYQTGRGKIKIRAKARIEERDTNAERIVVDELPYQTNKSRLIERIAQLVKDKKVSGITDLRDESDRNGIRVVVEIKRGENAQVILNQLYKYTELQVTFGIILLALDKGVPKVMNLKQILSKYIAHRFEVITRRTKFELDKCEKRAHVLEGFKIALDNIDQIIKDIKASKDANEAKIKLSESYNLSEIQAKSILDMRLQKLTGLEREKIDNEYNELIKEIEKLKNILGNSDLIYTIMKEELIGIKNQYNEKRRTTIMPETEDLSIEDLIDDEQVIVTVTNTGYIKRMPIEQYRTQKRGGKGFTATTTVKEDNVENMYIASNLDTMLIFTNKGRVHQIKVYKIPQSSKIARGILIYNLLNLDENEKVRGVIKIRDFLADESIFFATKNGIAKKTRLELYKNINKSGIRAINLKENDDLIYVAKVKKGQEIFIATKNGYIIRFDESQIKNIGRSAAGVIGIRLREEDQVIEAVVVENEESTILTIAKKGYGKRTKIKSYKNQHRGGKGVINLKVSKKTGEVVSIKEADGETEVIIITKKGIGIRTSTKKVSIIGRATQGVKIMNVKNDEITSVVKVDQANV